jgi:hypothetical protein
MKPKIRPIEKKILITYALFLGILLLCNIYLSYNIQQFESTDWNYIMLTKTLLYTIPTTVLITYILIRIITIKKNENNNKIFIIGFAIAAIFNFALILCTVHIGAKWYNIYGANQKQVLVEGKITNVYTKNKIKKRNNRKYYVTIDAKQLLKEIIMISKKSYTINEVYSETLTKGSLGFFYKK